MNCGRCVLFKDILLLNVHVEIVLKKRVRGLVGDAVVIREEALCNRKIYTFGNILGIY